MVMGKSREGDMEEDLKWKVTRVKEKEEPKPRWYYYCGHTGWSGSG